MDYYVDEKNNTVVIKNTQLNLPDGKYIIKSFLLLNNIIAKCDLDTQAIIRDAFLKAYMNNQEFKIDYSLEESKEENIEQEEVENNIESVVEESENIFSPVEHTITSLEENTESETQQQDIEPIKEEPKEEIDEVVEIKNNGYGYTIIIKNDYLDIKNEFFDSKTDIENILKSCSEATRKHVKDFINDHKYDMVFVESTKELTNDVEQVEQEKNDDDKNGPSSNSGGNEENKEDIKNENIEEPYSPEIKTEDQKEQSVEKNDDDYKVDKSQYKYKELEDDYSKIVSNGQKEGSLLERLQTINKSERIFTDEQRIEDKSLNVNNSVSLGKITNGKLIVKDEPMPVNTKKNTVLEMPKKMHTTFKNICNKSKDTKIAITIKNGINQVTGTVSKAGTFLAQMPKELSKKISNGSKIMFLNSVKNKIDEWKENASTMEYDDEELARAR